MMPLGVLASARVAPSTPTRLLAAHWAMGEAAGAIATDSVNGVVATLPGSSRWVAGIDGTAVQVDPGNILSAVASWPTHTWNRLTVEWSMRLDSGSGDAMVLDHGTSGAEDVLGFWVSNTTAKVWCYMGGSIVGNVPTALATTLGTWHVWRINVTPTSGLELWRDGALIVSHPATGAYIGRSSKPIASAYIAGSPWGSPGQTVDDWKLLGPTL